MKSLGTWLPPCDSLDLSVKLDTQGQNQLTGALWDTPGGPRIPGVCPIHSCVRADTRGHVVFIRKQQIKRNRQVSPLETGCGNMPKCIFCKVEEKGMASFPSRKVPEYYLERRVCRFLGIGYLVLYQGRLMSGK